MNIRQAKEEVAHAVEVYLAKDDNGLYLIPVERQRPLFLLGAPGLGKTAIMEQIAQETGGGPGELFDDASYAPKRSGSSVSSPSDNV